MTIDYRPTVFLPQTEFPMRGDLPKREPVMLERWRTMGLEAKRRAGALGREKFVLHDGPPYANGNLHIGHALNKILKDVINRAQQMLGKDAVYVPGWDCHGLPIEWKIEEKYRARKRSKDDVPILEFRKECRDFAAHWIAVQSAEFQRLGVAGDWAHPYTTMAFAAEAQIVREIGKFLMNGGLYRGAKPVMWSVVEQTALAEAEIEYHDHTSDQVWVRFPVSGPAASPLAGAAVAIWTTTPWTLPGNRAIAYNATIDYGVVEVTEAGEGSLALPGERIVLAAARRDAVEAALGFKTRIAGDARRRRACRHAVPPSAATARATNSRCRCCPAISSPTATAPASSTSRRATARTITSSAAGSASRCRRPWPATAPIIRMSPLFAGRRVYRPDGKRGDANGAVIEALRDAGALLGAGQARPFLSAFLALQGAAHLSQHAAMVHLDGDEPAARQGARGDRRDAVDSAAGQEPHPRHDRDAARLVRLAPARLGRADRRLRRRGRPASRCATRPLSTASPPRSSAMAPMPGTAPTRATFLGRAAIPPITSRSWTSSMSGSTAARPMPSCSSGAPISPGQPRSISKAPTSIAAGSIPRC